jgi:prolyl-tRNA synthetase
MDQAYRAILQRCGLAFRAVDADSGAIGGAGSQEFMVLADAGEDAVLYTEDGKYAANIEKAISLPADAVASPFATFEKKATPNCNTIESLAEFLDCSPTCIVKNILYLATFDNGKQVLILVSIRGDQQVNGVKLTNELTKLAVSYGATTLLALTVPEADVLSKLTVSPLPLGYLGPDLDDQLLIKNKDLAPQFLRLVDQTATDLKNFVTGANDVNTHVIGANWQQNIPLPKYVVDIRESQVGDRAVHDPSQTLQTARGIEVGHIFQLGTKYSQAMGATFTNEQGEENPLVMGCYGIGVSRLAQAAVEQGYDKDGIIWPTAIAPYEVVIVIPNVGDAEQVKVAEQLYADLQTAGIDVLLDDRNERAGVKFKDSELIGIPYRVVTGKSLKQGQLEVVKRATKEVSNLAIAEVVPTLTKWIDQDKN